MVKLRYKNIKTGAIIDSPFNISGVNWEQVDGSKKEQAETEVTEEEYVEEEVNLEEMTNKELESFAKEHDIALTSDDKRNKETRINAIAKAFE